MGAPVQNDAQPLAWCTVVFDKTNVNLVRHGRLLSQAAQRVASAFGMGAGARRTMAAAWYG